LHNILLFAGDVMHIIILHRQSVPGFFAIVANKITRSGIESVKIIVIIPVLHLSANTIGCRTSVYHSCYILNIIIGIGIIHQHRCAFLYRKGIQQTVIGLVGVVGFRAVAVFQVRALFKLIIPDIGHIICRFTSLISRYTGQQSSGIIAVIHFFPIRIGHFQQAVPAFVFSSGNIVCHALIGYYQRSAHFGDFALPPVFEFLCSAAVFDTYQPTGPVIRILS